MSTRRFLSRLLNPRLSVACWLGFGLSFVGFGCQGQSNPTAKQPRAVSGAPPYGIAPIDLPQSETHPGTAVVILVDTSGSMAQEVPDRGGKRRPKDQIARAALARIIDYTAKWKQQHPTRPLQLGIFNFASTVSVILPISEFDQAKAKAALARIPRPSSNTAIGRALEEGFKALYRSGCARKYVVCITDGENTAGPPPDRVARQLHAQTAGAVEMHFVAFDTSARQFDFLRDVNGHVVEAANGDELQKELSNIYEKRILAEAEEPGATEAK